jgi:ribose-phosphate pyrophosphokinase
MPYFPYARQSKKKSHRGAITARMVANLLNIAGVDHVITIDLHASQMQGFFKCPVDNLIAEPLLARWIRVNVPNWREAVVVSKNPGGTKRVTSLADALKLSFGIVTTDRRRAATAVPWNESAMFEQLRLDGTYETPELIEAALDADAHILPAPSQSHHPVADIGKSKLRSRAPSNTLERRVNGTANLQSPLSKSMRAASIVSTKEEENLPKPDEKPEQQLAEENSDEEEADEYTDEVCFLAKLLERILTTLASERCHSRPTCTGTHCGRNPPFTFHVRSIAYLMAKSRSIRRRRRGCSSTYDVVIHVHRIPLRTRSCACFGRHHGCGCVF